MFVCVRECVRGIVSVCVGEVGVCVRGIVSVCVGEVGCVRERYC